ncbi:MAG: YezD family protein [Clostridia bacterium]|nr:YezD family protein [Clostridia bacterium]
MADKTPNPTEQAILQAVRTLDYGTVAITVHDGKPTLLEVSKKIKLVSS